MINLFPTYGKELPQELKDAVKSDFLKADKIMLCVLGVHWLMSFTVMAYKHGFYKSGLIAGSIIFAIAFAVYFLFKGTVISRCVLSMLVFVYSALFIQLNAGQIEAHFHIFLLLPFLTRYKDILPLVCSVLLIAVHHAVFNYCQQQGISIGGIELLVFSSGPSWETFFIHAFFVIIGLFLYSYFILENTKSFFASESVNATISRMSKDNDLTLRVQFGQQEEVNQFLDQIHFTVQQVKKQASTLVVSSDSLNHVTEQLSSDSSESKLLSEKVSASSKDLNKSMKTLSSSADVMVGEVEVVSETSVDVKDKMNTVAAALEEAQVNLSSIAAASNKLTSSVEIIAEQTDKGRNLSNKAVECSNDTSKRVAQLDEAGKEIEKIIGVIVEISEQTKNLALNATIEAARAGEAGKGFAVVANEVKDLAKQTNDATDSVREFLDKISESTDSTVKDINNISIIIRDMNNIVNDIAKSIHSQNVTLKDNSENIGQISLGISEITENSQRTNEEINTICANTISFSENCKQLDQDSDLSLKVCVDVNSNIQEIKQLILNQDESITEVNKTSQSLNGVVSDLNELVDKFKI